MNTLRTVRRLRGCLLPLLVVLGITGCSASSRSEKPIAVFFFEADCDDCSRMKEALQVVLDDYCGLTVRYVDFGTSSGKSLLQRLALRYGLQLPLDPPVILVCDTAIVGEGESQGLALRDAVAACVSAASCSSPLE